MNVKAESVDRRTPFSMAHARKDLTLAALYTAFALTGSALCSPFDARAHERVVSYTGTKALSQSQPMLSSNARRIITFVMLKLEGSGFVVNDNGGGPSRYGIVGRYNGLSFLEVVNLTPDRAASIYKTNYWDAVDADSLPSTMQLAAFNAAIEFGPERAREMIMQAQGDPQALLKAGADFCKKLAQTNPKKYEASLEGWKKRQILLASYNDTEILVINLHPTLVVTSGAPKIVSHVVWPSVIAPLVPQTPFQLALDKPSVVIASAIDKPPATPAIPDGTSNRWILWLGVGAIGYCATFRNYTPQRRRSYKRAALFPQSTAMLSPIDPTEEKTGVNKKAQTPFFLLALVGFSETERAAFLALFSSREPRPQRNETQWRVDCGKASYVVIEKNLVTIEGDGGIEDSLRYAAQAWGNKCKIVSGLPETIDKMKVTAQKLVDSGILEPGFTIEGLPPFYRRPDPMLGRANFSALRA